ncbi:MAG TPA: FtsX-like permease family protein [Steroidobacteraceae bacterium]|nr:FtsX-like permease family protein [Steroidobacteraceae bacterium]
MKALLLDAWRGLQSRRGSTLVAMGGLMLAMAACLLVALLAIALSDPDPAIPDPEHVVMLEFKGNLPGQPNEWFTSSPLSFAAMLKERHVPLDLISRAAVNGLDINNQGRLQPAYLLLADPDLLPLLGIKALHGNLQTTLTQRDAIAINITLVRKLWGELPPAQALGRRLESRGTFYTVTAILPNPDPRAPLFEANPLAGGAMALVGFESQANVLTDEDRKAIYLVQGRVFARLRPGVSVSEIGGWMRAAFMANPLYAKLPADWKTGREAAYFRAVTLTQLPFEGAANHVRWQLIGAVAAASALLLVLAAFNGMNLQAANLLQRQRETALRRSLGADDAQLLRLWSLEVLLTLLLAAAGGLLLAWWLAPGVAHWMGLSPAAPIADPLPLRVLLGLACTVLVLWPLTLALPAWMALRQAPAPALQGRTASEGPWGRRMRQGLLTLQLGGALLLLSLAGVLALQQQHLLHADRGFETHNRLWLGVLVNPALVPNMDAFLAALNKHPAIQHWAFSDGRPARDTQGGIELNVSPSQHKAVLRVTPVSPGFFDTYGMTLLAGSPRTGSGEEHLVIDAKAARLLGFASPQAAIGALLRGGGGFLQEGTELRRVVAVVKDVKLESARDPALPQAFLLSDKPQWDLTVHGPNLAALRQALEELWKAHGPPLVYDIQSADDQRADVYRQEGQLTTMLAAVALLAVGVAMVGAYALVADTLRRRRTELVLRRLHGAGNAAIARETVSEFTAPLLIAVAIGLPIAVWLGERYLHGFVDRVDFVEGVGLPLLVAMVVSVLITAMAATRHVRGALALQPIEALS